MPKSKKLTDKQRKFCEEYLIDLNATQAAIRAKYSPKTAQRIGSENLSKPLIDKEIKRLQAKLREQAREKGKIATPEEILEGYTRDARFDPGLLFDESKKPIPVPDLPKDIRLSLRGVKIKKNDVIEYKFPDKRLNRDSIAKIMGLTNQNEDIIKNLIQNILGRQVQVNVGKEAIELALNKLIDDADGMTRGIPSMHHLNQPKNVTPKKTG